VLQSFNAQIFNRWGKKVFEWTDPKDGWDGSESQSGVYYYIVTMTTPYRTSRRTSWNHYLNEIKKINSLQSRSISTSAFFMPMQNEENPWKTIDSVKSIRIGLDRGSQA
jgi:hypothetical protein